MHWAHIPEGFYIKYSQSLLKLQVINYKLDILLSSPGNVESFLTNYSNELTNEYWTFKLWQKDKMVKVKESDIIKVIYTHTHTQTQD